MHSYNTSMKLLIDEYIATNEKLMKLNTQIYEIGIPEFKQLLASGDIVTAKLFINNLPSCPTRMKMAGLYEQHLINDKKDHK